MASLQARLWNWVFRRVPQIPADVEHDYIKERNDYTFHSEKAPGEVQFEKLHFNGIYAEKISAKQPGDLLIWYLHGGGLTSGAAVERRSLCKHLAKKYQCTCIASDYRLSPEYQWPAHLDDCIQVYDGMLENGYDPKKMVIMGDSAGGMLVLSVALRLAMEQKPLPAALVAFSPITVMPNLLPSRTKNVETDFMLRDGLNRPEYLRAIFGELWQETEKLKTPLMSPYYGDYSMLPPIFLAASDTETLCDDTRYLYRKLKEEGHDVEMVLERGVFHAYPIIYFMPESKMVWRQVMKFIRRCVR